MSIYAPIVPWVKIDAAMLERYAPSSVIDALRNADTSEVEDRLPGMIETVTLEIRNAVASCLVNKVDVDSTLIPKDLEACACWMIIDRLQNVARLGLTDAMRESLAREVRKLKDVASGTLKISYPVNPVIANVEPKPLAQTVRSTSRRPLQFTQDGMSGL